MKYLGSNHKTAAAWNRTLAIRLLRRHGTLSRNDISQMTQLQGSTLSYIVRELQGKNIVRVVGKRKSDRVGPKQVLLTLNPEFGWVVGISLRPERATLVLVDASGKRVDGMTLPISGPLEGLPVQLDRAIAKWVRKRDDIAGKMLAMGVAVPGVVDADAGVVLRSTLFHAVNVPLQQLLADRFGVTATVDHDACYAAAAEAVDGAASGAAHFIYLSINAAKTDGGWVIASYGSALYLGGNIYRGAFYGAGELSAPLLPKDWPLTNEELALLADPDGGMPTGLIDLADTLGRVLAPMINFVDVQMVVLGGTVNITNRRFMAAVQARVTEALVPIPGRAVRIVRSALEPEAAARGAAISSFDQLVSRGLLFDEAEDAANSQISTPSAG